MLNLKLITILAALAATVAALFASWNHQQVRTAQIKETITVTDTAKAVAAVQDR